MTSPTDNKADTGDVEQLVAKAIIAFDGSTINGLTVHPDGTHIVYPVGNKVLIQNWETKTQEFLVGHTNLISAVAVSTTGKYVASGQVNHIGFKARVILWDFETRKAINQHEAHSVRVEAVTFSKDEQYMISLGGRDCGSVVIFNMAAGQVLCGAQVSRGVQGQATVLLGMTRRGACFMTAGDCHLAVWKIDQGARNVKSVDVSMNKLRRTILCMDANERDETCYCGTTTGDILKIRLNFHHDPEILEPVKQPCIVGCFAKLTRKKLPRGCVDLYESGVRSIRIFCGWLIIGAGDGTLELVEETAGKIVETAVKLPSVPALKVLKSTHVNSSVSSIQMLNDETILVGTVRSEIYTIDMNAFVARLVVTCHKRAIHDIAFPQNFSEVFATAGQCSVRVWSLQTAQELLRIGVPNFTCSSVLFSYDGKSIITAWNDGIIRSFTPLTGRLIYSILNAHNKGVSALATTTHGKMLISGGCEGQVRLWKISPFRQELICTLKEHHGPISAISINKFNTEAASASADGTCIIWDLERQCRRQILFSNTLLLCVKYYPTGVQILTGSADRKIAYWEVLDGSLVRELEGSSTGTINALDISPDGENFVTGGNDQIVKLWNYQEGITTHIGVGHTTVITAARFSPNKKYILTTDAAGGVFIWESPHKPPKEEKQIPEPLVLPVADKEENIKDLPSVRSSVHVKSNRSEKSCVCLSTTSSRKNCCGMFDEAGDSVASTARSGKCSSGYAAVKKCGSKSSVRSDCGSRKSENKK